MTSRTAAQPSPVQARQDASTRPTPDESQPVARERPRSAAYDALRQAMTLLDLMLHREVVRLRVRHQLVEDEYRGFYIPDEQIDALLQKNVAPGDSSPTIEWLAAQIRAVRAQPAQDSPLRLLAQRFDLDTVETDLLLIALAPALDLRYEIFYAYVQNDVDKKYPTLDLALKLLFEDVDDRLHAQRYLDASAHLRRYQLLHFVPNPRDVTPSPLAHVLKIDKRIVAHVLQRQTGHDVLDERLQLSTRLVTTRPELGDLPLPPELAQRIAQIARALAAQPGPVLLHGAPGVGKETVAAAMSAHAGLNLLAVDWSAARSAGHAASDLVAWLTREAILHSAAIYFSCEDDVPPGLSSISVPVFVGGSEPFDVNQLRLEQRYYLLELPLPDFERRLEIWQKCLPAGAYTENGHDLKTVAGKFILTERQIRVAARQALVHAETQPQRDRTLTIDDIQGAARFVSNQALRDLARKMPLNYGWDDIVLPAHSRQQLWEVYLSVKHRHTVYGQWGFDGKLSAGKGINALFHGPSGTGKTMAAEILAAELGLDLYRIDLSTVVSKYIGETEKNLSRIFAAAEASNAILLFDEADALFGKRSEVKDARDRYANIEVAYLLQKMEEYDGMAVLATNLRANMDDAFARRLHHTVEFPQPDARLRERIWRGLFPQQTPLHDDIDFTFLARQFELTGGNIRNVALSAAFLAAEAGQPIRMEHLIRGVARELQKLGKLPAKADFRDYYALANG